MQKLISRFVVIILIGLIYSGCHKEKEEISIHKGPFDDWVGTWKMIGYRCEINLRRNTMAPPGSLYVENYKLENGKLIHSVLRTNWKPDSCQFCYDGYVTDYDTTDFQPKFLVTTLKNDTLFIGNELINLKEGIFTYGYYYDYSRHNTWNKSGDTLRHSYNISYNEKYNTGIETWLKTK